jgi:hypothetical protein
MSVRETGICILDINVGKGDRHLDINVGKVDRHLHTGHNVGKGDLQQQLGN